MADNFNDPFAQNLVGLWDFLGGNPNGDTGLADGIAQDGTPENGATISGDRLHLDGHNDYFDVDGDHGGPKESVFDLDEGTIVVQFTPTSKDDKYDDKVESGFLVNRGEYSDKGDEGWFGIEVDEYGRIKLEHRTEHEYVKLETEKGLFGPDDDVKVTYSWDASSGVTLTVENLTTGEIETITDDQTGLTMDIGDNDDEIFTFGAREEDDGEYDEFFEGSIAYVAVYDRDIINNPPPLADGIVDGTAGADLIDVTYTGDPEGDSIDAGDAILPGEAPNDDIVDAGAGNDTILAGLGDDDVYAGSGNDSVEGGAGDDLIFGDSNLGGGTGPGTVRESFEWDLAGVSNGNDLGGFTQDTGNVNVTFSILQQTGHADTEFANNDQNVSGIVADGNPVDDNSSLDSTANGHGNEADYRLDFSDPVENVSFRVNDIDGDGVVRIRAFDATGNPIVVNLTAGSKLTLLDTDGVAGADTADSNGGYLDDTSSDYSILVDIPGPVSRIEIEHDQNGGNNSGVNVTDIYYDAPMADSGTDGNDVLSGGDGDDTIFGEGGDDTLRGGNDDDSLSGGDGNDVIDGGAGSDTLEGGDGDDLMTGDGAAVCLPGSDLFETRAQDISNVVLYFDTNGDGQIDYSVKVDGFPDGGTSKFISNDLDDYFGQMLEYVYEENPDLIGASITAGVSIKGGTEPTLFYAVTGDTNGALPDDGPVDNTGPGNDMVLDYADFFATYDPNAAPPSTDPTSFNDLLDGGAGNDTLSGECGDDVLIGGTGNDVLSGDEGADTVSGGADADTIFGGAGDEVDGGSGGFNTDPALNTDLDVLDLTGQGPFYLDNVTPDSNGNGIDGTVVFVNPDGTPNGLTLTFTEIEKVIGDQVNRDPDAVDDTATVGEDDGPTVINLTGNDSDPDVGDDVEIASIDTTGTIGTVTINPDKEGVTYNPNGQFESLGVGETATDTFTYTVEDGNGGTDTATVTVTIKGANDDPTANDDASNTDFNTPVTFNVLANDTDPDASDVLTITSASSPNGTVDNNGDGTLTFTPTPGFEGPAEITYEISDGNGGTDTAVWTVTVAEQPLDGIVSGTDAGELIDVDYLGDPEGDRVDNNDEILPGEGPNDDIIKAGGGNDTIIAGEGDDDVFAGAGDDRVHGGPGDDILRGEDGEDSINGGAGDDTVDGGNDDDVINTGDGSDVVEGGEGNDLINTGNGEFAPDLGFPNDDGTPAPGFPFGYAADANPDDDRDSVDGGAGDDTISTGDDADTITGGTGNDVIDGGIDDDEISGDDGADRIVGGEGNDLIEGGTGDDSIYAGNDPVLGLDQLNIEDDGSNPIFPSDPRPDNGMDTVFGGEGNDLIFGADDDDVLYGEEGNDTIDGEIDEDFIDGGIGDDSLLGGQGNDTIEGGDGNDFIDGGDQKDTLNGGDGDDTIFGGNGDDQIDGGAGNDLIDGGTGGDSKLFGGAGNDTILGSTGRDTIDGGDGNDLIDLGNNSGGDIAAGGADRDTFVNVTEGDVVDGGGDGDDFDTLDLRGSTPSDGSLKVVFTGPDANGNGFDGVVNYFDRDGNAAGQLVFTDIEDVIPCFTPGTLIATPQGERRVEDLEVGDRVITRDNGIQQIRWVGARDMSQEELARATHLRPILIRKGALGAGLPERDMLVSPQHRVLMSNDKTALYFDESEVLVAAKHLVGMDGIEVAEVSETTYIHVMFDQHEVILSDGAWTESFQPGDQTLASMGDAQRAEILELFPELDTANGIAAYTAARRSLKKHEAVLLAQ